MLGGHMNIHELLSIIGNTPATSDKYVLIRAHHSTLLDQIFQDTYDKNITYGIKDFEVIQSMVPATKTIDRNYNEFRNLLQQLTNRTLTGMAARTAVGVLIGCFIPEDQEILRRIIDRNLKIGVSLDNYNRALGKQMVKKYRVALADKLENNPGIDPCCGEYYVSRKLDGVRCNIHINNYIKDNEFIQDIQFISRQGKRLTTLNNLIESIKDITAVLSGRWVLDGEVCIIGEDGHESFKGLMSEITRKNHTITKPRFMWFDLVRYEEFIGDSASEIFEYRLKRMHDLYYHSNRPEEVTILSQSRLTSQRELDQWLSDAEDGGWEGLMLRRNTSYKPGRSSDLLKIKKMQDAEYVVVDVIRGKAVYNEGGSVERDVISALVIIHKGNRVQVGSGLSKNQRLEWYENPEKIIGKTVTIKYFEETQDKKTRDYSLRFPVLKYVYNKKRDV